MKCESWSTSRSWDHIRGHVCLRLPNLSVTIPKASRGPVLRFVSHLRASKSLPTASIPLCSAVQTRHVILAACPSGAGICAGAAAASRVRPRSDFCIRLRLIYELETWFEPDLLRLSTPKVPVAHSSENQGLTIMSACCLQHICCWKMRLPVNSGDRDDE